MRRLTSVAVWLALSTPAFAQTPQLPQATFSRSYAPAVRPIDWSERSAARPYTPSETGLDGGLPSNLSVPDGLQPVVESMWRKSPTFRRQCARLANARGLSVVVTMGLAPDVTWARAQTQVVGRGQGRLEATVHIRPPDDVVELIAHEIEHVIEQLDGVDLHKKTDSGDDSVSLTDHHAFETRRARETGLKVSREFRAWDR